jgi:pimeloyl-ACP methyl ester carboxylesterase
VSLRAAWGSLGFGVVLGVLACSGQAAAQTSAPAFQQTPCGLPSVTPGLAPRLQCGTVAVPRDRGSPEAGTFRLAVVVVKAAADRREGDPVVYIAGGPGSPLTRRAALIARHGAEVVAPDRDLILVDQRGAGRSEPALCPGLARQHLAIFAAGAEQGALVRAWRESYDACRQQMAAEGLQPEWFGTQITAADFEAVRQALGIGRWNVYALSYGTAVAMTMMALHPASLRAMVLDSVLPPDPLPMTLSQSFGRALDMLFAACQADAACTAAHPGLATSFSEAARGLDADPLPVPMPPGLGVDILNLRAQVFRLIVNRALYSRQAMAVLPAFIEAARDRNAMAMQGLIGTIAQGYLADSHGDMAAVECRDRARGRNAAPSDDLDDPPVSAFVAGMCRNWSAPGPPPLTAKDTAVPSLLLTGTVDPIAPPAFARMAAAGMGAEARVVEFAHVGHGAQQSSACGEGLVTAFIRNPSNTADPDCAAQIPPVGFQ